MVKKIVKLKHIKLASLYLIATFLLCSCADLIVRDVRYEPLTATGRAMNITIANQGSEQAPASTTSIELRYNWYDPYTQYARIQTDVLAAGQEIVLTIPAMWQTQPPTPGDCLSVRICADTDNVVEEGTREFNNCLTKSTMNREYCPSCDLCCEGTLPDAFDWRNWKGRNWVTPVKDQGDCGSCWTFSAVAAVEAKKNVEGNPDQISHINLSERELVYCSGLTSPCHGFTVPAALNYIQYSGIVTEQILPYFMALSDQLACYVASLPASLITGFFQEVFMYCRPLHCNNCDLCDAISTANEKWYIGSQQRVVVTGLSASDRMMVIKRALLCHGPLSVSSVNWDHGVLLVGWHDNEIEISVGWVTITVPPGWIIKNSWGTGWGIDGYGYIPYGHSYSDMINFTRYVQDVSER